MTNNIVPLNFTFSDETIKDGLVNISALASAYQRAYQKGSVGKKPTSSLCRDWLATKEAQDSIAYLERASGLPQASLVIVENGVGTWVHADLAEIFAQWISVEYRFAVVRLIRETKEKEAIAAKAGLEDQFAEPAEVKLLKDIGALYRDAFGESYYQRWVMQQVQKHYPSVAGDNPAPQEMCSLPTAHALVNVSELANQLGVFYKTGNPNPRPINQKLIELGFQDIFVDSKGRKKYNPTEKAIALKLCDRKPIATNSNSQQDQILWSIEIVAILKEYFLSVY